MQQSELIDISPIISEGTAVWPGDVSFSRSIQASIAAGSNIDLSSLTTTVHIGAHADAPSHYRAGANPIDKVDLTAYIGPCQVITVAGKKLIEPSDLDGRIITGTVRVLIRTLSFPDPNHFNEDFTAFSPEVIEWLGSRGCRLVGIDTPSVDPFDSKPLPAHQALARCNIRNLEGLTLKHVKDGVYELIALPLRLAGFDASPVRAVLRTI